eukprot:TRINITY_DN25076_c0_g1_i1.p1 TRINITY_DN25076_c0_g1~~TRINITY_DN25076_c0_g1_i1.p1  ORF type:complete len:629 (+),score=78.36 TRINITY_DN25076_c0_g1_i1:128-1888(+)
MAPAIGVYSCAQATALCRNLAVSRDHLDTLEAQRRKARRIEHRLARRAERRANGETISPTPTSPYCSLATNIRLAGYQALREIFPESPRHDLIEALVAVQAMPVAERAVHAARLIFKALRDQRLSIKVQIDEAGTKQRQVELTRSRSTIPCHRAPVEPSSVPETIDVLQSSESGKVQPPKYCFLARSRSIPASVKLVSAESGVRAKQRMESHAAMQVSQRHVPEDERYFTSAGKRHKERLRARHEKKSRRSRVDRNLLAASIPSFEVLHALPAALTAAAEMKVDDDADDAQEMQEKSKPPLTSWTSLQRAFRAKHGKQILEELGKGTVLSPVQPQTSNQFLQSCRSVLEGSSLPIPSYHGTSQRNITSISNRGLLVPGEGNVQVAHGSAHGVGIYVAKLGCSFLSKGFCDSDKLFICGVVDSVPEEPRSEPDIVVNVPRPRTFGMGLQHRQHHLPLQVLRQKQLAKQQHQQQHRQGVGWVRTMGRFNVHRETTFVRHVGSAMVVFNKGFVAPLFLAHCSPDRDTNSPINHMRAGKRQTLVPEMEDAFWDPPVPATCKYGRSVKRRLERRRWKTQRAVDRQEKYGRV